LSLESVPLRKIANKLEANKIKIKRNLAISELIEICESNDIDVYIALDFMLDRLLREALGLPEKSLGKPPYKFLNY
jgi:hypothetical protein